MLYVPSLASNLLSVYQMTHTGSPKRVMFGLDLVEITDIFTENIIAKGITNHDNKAYEFSHLMTFSELVHSQKEGKNIPSPSLVVSTSITELVVSVHQIQIQIQIQSLLPSRKLGI